MSQLLEEKVIELKLDRSAWQLVKFGDIAVQQKGNVDRDNTDLTKYIKGEHMSSEDLHLREWGELTDEYLGPAFIRKFQEGDILYGSRRTYLRKVAIARFSGITSNTTFVIKANEAKIDKRLLPFVMLSEGFAEHSIRNSKGSVNPYVNWKDLADYEFLLPPKDQQAKLADLLWAMDEVVEKSLVLFQNLSSIYKVYVEDLFSKRKVDWQYIFLGKIADINKNSLKTSTDPDYEFQYLDIASIVEPKVIGDMLKVKFSESPSRARRVVTDNSIVIALVRPYQKSFVFIEHAPNIIASTGTAVVNVKEKFNTKFVFHQFFSKKFIQFCENRMTGTNYPAITSSDLEQFIIGMPHDILTQSIHAQRLDSIDSVSGKVKSKIEIAKSLHKSLINQIF